MTYLQSITRIFALDQEVYQELDNSGKLFRTAFINLLLLGLLFGVANIINAQQILRQDFTGGFDNPTVGTVVFAALIFASTAQIFMAHAGFALLLWAIARGFKGLSAFFPIYLLTAAASAPLWLGLPFLFLYLNQAVGLFGLILGALGLAWAAATYIRSIMVGENFTAFRASAALAVTIIFIVSLRILWS